VQGPKCKAPNCDNYAWGYEAKLATTDEMKFQVVCKDCGCEFDVTCTLTIEKAEINVERDSKTKG
jgi:hypothetical protein